MSQAEGASQYRLLLVDDNTSTLRLLDILLSGLGHSVTPVESAAHAIDACKEADFHLVFTDLQMPGMTGLELAETLRNNGFCGPIIALTAHLTAFEREELIRQGLNDALEKPVSRKDLSDVMESWLELGEIIPQPARTRQPRIYDEQLALTRANGDPQLASEMLDLLVESLEIDLAGLNLTASNAEHELFRSTLHSMLGAVRFSGASLLEFALQQLESVTRGQRKYHAEFHASALNRVNSEVAAVNQWYKVKPKQA